jgi:hypothetical protein
MDNKKQIYFLSRFPTFRGTKYSLVPQKDFNLSNYSGCLGSYGLLFRPGDFAFVSATRLDTYLNGENKINGNDLFILCEERNVYFRFLPQIILGNYHSSRNAFDFVDKYLRLCIGEPIIMEIGRRNITAKNFLYELLSVIRKKAEEENNTNILKFCNTFFNNQSISNTDKGSPIDNNTSDFHGGGIGIIHTIIDLGEQ